MPIPGTAAVFTDTYNFLLAVNGLLDISVSNTGKVFSEDLTNTYSFFVPFNVELDGTPLAYISNLDPVKLPSGTPGVTVQNRTQTYSFGPGLFSAGAHSLTVAGTTDPDNDTTYSGHLSLSAAPTLVLVSEPESYGLVLAGLGALGLLTRRRQACVFG